MSEATTTRWEQYNEAGRLFFLQGDLARAEESFVAAVSEAETLGADNVRLASSLSNLGQLKYQQRDLASAEGLFRRSLDIRERSLGHDHISVAQNLNNLAALHVARNEHAEAEALLVRALHINERERGGSHPDVAVTINNLAKLHFKRGDYASAEPLLLRLLALKQTPDKNNPEAAAVLASLATLRQATGHPAAAESLWKETLAVRERSLSATDAALAPTLEGLADACEAQRRWSEAIAHRERALPIRVQVMGADHPAVTAARGRIAELRVSANLMTLETGVYCVFPAPGSPEPDPVTGLPGVRVTPCPGTAGRPDHVSVSTFRADGWLENTAALVQELNRRNALPCRCKKWQTYVGVWDRDGNTLRCHGCQTRKSGATLRGKSGARPRQRRHTACARAIPRRYSGHGARSARWSIPRRLGSILARRSEESVLVSIFRALRA